MPSTKRNSPKAKKNGAAKNGSQASKESARTALNLKDPRYYFNRELSWVRFNERVLEEAYDTNHPLLERLKFLAIYASNLDEFFMIRVAGLKEQINAGIEQRTPDGRSPQDQVNEISELLHPLNDSHSECFEQDILPKLAKEGIFIKPFKELPKTRQEAFKTVFDERIFPALTPLAVDPAHPFPKVRGLGINLLVTLRDPKKSDDGIKRAVIPIPKAIPRFMQADIRGGTAFVTSEEIIKAHLSEMFYEMEILRVNTFRVTRNADLDISEAEADDLLKLIERELRKRRVGTVIRLEVTSNMPSADIDFLMDQLKLEEADRYQIGGLLNLSSLFELYGQLGRPELKDAHFQPALHPQVVESDNIFEAICKGDFMVLHPYDSFQPVVEFLETAADDPNVIAIKQTVYRATDNSPIVRALRHAAENGKQVLALIELKARFDEQANIKFAKSLEESGVNVVYGLLGLKTHCKTSMVLRREDGKIRSYMHLSTGNYNEKTAKLYTDLGMFTCDEEIGKDMADLFNLLTGYSRKQRWRKLLVAPTMMRKQFVERIEKCIDAHTADNPSRIQLVMNSLVDPDMIRWLYRCSMKGIQVDLVVRGICCLVPGVPGISENIRVRSIVGRFLEHTRIFCFQYDQQVEFYAGSADWMQRNLNRRIEVIYPVEQPDLKRKLQFVIAAMWKDNVKARELQSDGTYQRVDANNRSRFNLQEFLLNRAQQIQQSIDTTKTFNRSNKASFSPARTKPAHQS